MTDLVRRPPKPPSRASVDANGRLKNTAANRALFPITMPAAEWESETLRSSAYYADDLSLVFNGEVSDVLRNLVSEGVKVDCIVTSPPFYGQRDYGMDEQIGLEKSPQQFIDSLVEVFDLCWELLSETGSLWVNLGDTYWSGKGAAKGKDTKQSARRFGTRPQDAPGDGVWARPKQLLLIPHRFAISMQDNGWLVRNDNVWIKPNPVPDQVRDRCSVSKEYMFHFTKSRWYYFDREPVARPTPKGMLPPLDTWTINTSRGGGAHKASFSEELIRIPILATAPQDGVVLDPFMGSGTSLHASRKRNIRNIGIDLNPGYCEQAVDSMLTVAL